MPKQGNKAPWKNYQNYLKDIFAVRIFSIKDSNLNFYNSIKKNNLAVILSLIFLFGCGGGEGSMTIPDQPVNYQCQHAQITL